MHDHDHDHGGLTDADYWDASWRRLRLPQTLSFEHHVNRRWDDLFSRFLAGRAGQSVVEVGCAPGTWLIYFHRRWALAPTGIELSPVGAELTRRNAELTDADIHVIEADMFDPAIDDTFDVVWSGGLIEHFDNLDVPLDRLHDLVAPGGLLIASVPNLNRSLYWWLRRLLNPAVLRVHRVVSPADLGAAYDRLGLTMLHVGYHGTWNLEVVNYGRHRRFQVWANRIDRALGKLFGAMHLRAESRWLSPYVVAIGRRDADQPPAPDQVPTRSAAITLAARRPNDR